MEKNFVLPEAILRAILEYLSKRPYEEVAQGISALSRLKEIVPNSDEE